MFGMRTEHEYFECAECGCLQLVDYPEDLARYYPADRYYSFHQTVTWNEPRKTFRDWLRRKRNEAQLFRRGGLFGRLARRWPNPVAEEWAFWFSCSRDRSLAMRILDVGCGQGACLARLRQFGFQNLLGVDPYLPEEFLGEELPLRSCQLEDLEEGSFDLVMLHHVLEHVPHPFDLLRSVAKQMSDDGVCLVRIPLASQGPWKLYGVDWAELDAPRHTFLHTEQSFQQLAAASGLQIQDVQYEAEPFAFAVSEMYRQGIPLFDDQRGALRDWREEFSATECRRFEELALRYNDQGHAARAAFLLTRIPSASGAASRSS